MDERTSQIEQAAQAPFLILHDGDVRRALLDFEGKAFHYLTNKPGQRVLLLFATIATGASVGLYFWTRFTTLLPFLGASALAIFAVVVFATVYRWHKFAQTSFIAISEKFLFFGDHRHAWRVDWSLLDVQTLGFGSGEDQRLSGKLPVEIAGQKNDLYLYHPLVYVEDLHSVMFEMLTRMKGGDEALALALQEEE